MTNINTTADGEIILEPTRKQMAEAYEKLSAPVPKEFLETYTENGMEFTGYKAQYAINLLNEVFGLGNVRVRFHLDEIRNISGAWLVNGDVCIHLNDEYLADGIGACYANKLENALKGAKTSAFKNACRYLGIGNELYLAGHDEDIVTPVTIDETAEETVVPNDVKEVVELIERATTIGGLESVLPIISKTEGKAVKELLVKKFNDKKLLLLEKK